ncbi:hypothetical protein M3670_23690, partial [Cytobacillus kochii]
ARRVHHFADRTRFGFRRRATLADLFLLGARLVGRLAGSVLGLLRRFALRRTFGGCACLVLRGLRRRGFLLGGGLLGCRLLRCGGFRRGTLRSGFFLGATTLGLGRFLAGATLGFLAFEAFLTLAQLLRLLLEQLGLAARLFLA